MARAPRVGDGSGSGGSPNLPYWVAIVLAMAVLIAFTLLTSPFDPGASSSATPGASPGDAVAGEIVFDNRCSVCHGPGGEGIVGLGSPLTTSAFVAGLTDDELLSFLQTGRPTDDPLNTTGIAMPARGGIPALSDEHLIDVIAYVRTIGQA